MNLSKQKIPCPVLRTDNGDYPRDHFTSTLDVEETETQVIFHFLTSLTNADLRHLIQTGQASFVHHIECPFTGFRQALETRQMDFKAVIDRKNLLGPVSIRSLIIAKTNFPSFSSSGWSRKYSQMTFDLEPGLILAEAKKHSINISSDEELEKSDSFCFFVIEGSESQAEMSVDFESTDQIMIRLPSSAFSLWQRLSENGELAPVLHSIVLVPALTFVLCSLERKLEKNKAEENYRNKKWFQQLNKMLQEKFHMNLGSREFLAENKIGLAQKLTGTSVNTALNCLVKNCPEQEDKELKVPFISWEDLSTLTNRIQDFKKKATQPENDWVKEINEEFFKESNISMPKIELDMSAEKPILTDFENVKRIHQGLHLTRIQAADKRIWAALALGPFYRYVQYRWGRGNEKDENLLKSKYLFDLDNDFRSEEGLRRSYTRQAIARLWWIGELSCDKSLEDPYELTKILCESSDRIVSVFERNFSDNPKIVREIALTLKKAQNSHQKLNRNDVRELCKYLINLEKTYLLDSLPDGDIQAKLEEKIKSILQEKSEKIQKAKKRFDRY